MNADFQARVPELTFSGHVYSPAPSLGLIMINATVVRTGNPINTVFSIDEISEDGDVISHDQGRF